MSDANTDESIRRIVSEEFRDILTEWWALVGHGVLLGMFLAGCVAVYVDGGTSELLQFVGASIVVIPIAAVLSIILGGIMGAITMLYSEDSHE